jgi:uncharacterized protein
MAVVSVRGEAWLEADPEIAAISVTVQARDRDRRTVLDRIASRNAQVLATIKGYGEAVEKLDSGAASVYPDIQDSKRKERAGYAGQARVQVTITDFTVLGDLVAALADTELVTVSGPWWSLRPDSPVYRRARLAAAEDATRRAGEYAQAFGGQLGALIAAADAGLLAGQAGREERFYARAASGGVAQALGGGPPVLDFEPARQSVSAQVEARFTVLLPGS